MWNKVTIIAIETSVGVGGFKEGETRRKLGHIIALVAQNTLMIKKRTL
jgi:hypothetical protein